MNKPIVVERFADNGEHSHWELLGDDQQILWTEEAEMECGKNIKPFDLQKALAGAKLITKGGASVSRFIKEILPVFGYEYSAIISSYSGITYYTPLGISDSAKDGNDQDNLFIIE